MTSAGPAPASGSGAPADRVRALAAPAVGPYGMVVDDVEVVAAGSRRIVRIALDRDLTDLSPEDHTSPVPPLDLDAVADASRAIDHVLEREATALFGDRPYLLEVGSSGAERRLTLPRHFRANVGRLAQARLADGTDLVARIVAASPTSVTLRPEPDESAVPAAVTGKATKPRRGPMSPRRADPGPDRVVAYGDLVRARIRVEFGRAWDEPLDLPSLDGQVDWKIDGELDAVEEPIDGELDYLDDPTDRRFGDGRAPGDGSGGAGMGPARRGVVGGYGARGRGPRDVGGLED